MEYCGFCENNPILKEDIRIYVEKVRVEGNGVILLTGPSSCGKGEVAKSLCGFLSLSEDRHLSMGNILRRTIKKAREDLDFREKLSKEYEIDYTASVFDINKTKPEIFNKAQDYKSDLTQYFCSNNFISQLDWLEYCVVKGLLVPDDWTRKIIDALFENSPELHNGIIILDGYPRTITAAKYLLSTFSKLGLPIIKVLNMSITKEQMKIRAFNRGRNDDTEEGLERRYQFYVDKVQPCIDYLKLCLGSSNVLLIDAHQPIYRSDNSLDLEASIHEVTLSVMQALGLPGFLLDMKD